METVQSDATGRARGRATALALRGVVKRWAGRPVLAGLDLDLGRGEVAWLGGRNGSGKTTLLRILAGVIAADEGAVSLLGLDPRRDRREYQRRLGFQAAGNGGLYARLTVLHNLELWAGLALVPRARRRAAVLAAMDEFEIATLAARRVDRLSMGQRQRVRLAMAFLHEPSVILLDEPHTSLDPEGLQALARSLERVRAGGGSALWCAPTQEGIPLPADRCLRLDKGQVVAE